MRILVVDDNVELLHLVERSLARDDNEVLRATSAGEARRTLESEHVDLIVLDLGLPDGSGIDLCREQRAARPALPILVLTAQTAVSSRVRCLDAGADDYLGKPFAVAELRARVRALGRRRSLQEQEPLRLGECLLDFVARRATVAGRQAPITAREWSILEALMTRRGRVTSRGELLQAVWQRVDDAANGSLDVLLSRIRKKLGPAVVRTVRGEGYALGDG